MSSLAPTEDSEELICDTSFPQFPSEGIVANFTDMGAATLLNGSQNWWDHPLMPLDFSDTDALFGHDPRQNTYQNPTSQFALFDATSAFAMLPDEAQRHIPAPTQPDHQENVAVDPSTITMRKVRSKKLSKSHRDSDEQDTSRSRPRKHSRAFQEEEFEKTRNEDKREMFLERNRAAASKCRQKKKVWTKDLEERARELRLERQALNAHVAALKHELLELKCRCLEHVNCECKQLREYLTDAVAGLQPVSAALYQEYPDEIGYKPSSASATTSNRNSSALSPTSLSSSASLNFSQA